MLFWRSWLEVFSKDSWVQWFEAFWLHCHIHNEARPEASFCHPPPRRTVSPCGRLSSPLPVRLENQTCVVHWSWTCACFPFVLPGGVSNSIFDSNVSQQVMMTNAFLTCVLGGSWGQSLLSFLKILLLVCPTFLTCKIFIFVNINVSLKCVKLAYELLFVS